MKKQILTVLSIALFMFAMNSCGNSAEGTDNAKDTFSGTWKVVKAEGPFASLNEGTKYIFEGNNLVIKLGIIKTEYTFEKTDSILTYKMKDKDKKYEANYSFKNGQLILKPVGSDQILYLEKE